MLVWEAYPWSEVRICFDKLNIGSKHCMGKHSSRRHKRLDFQMHWIRLPIHKIQLPIHNLIELYLLAVFRQLFPFEFAQNPVMNGWICGFEWLSLYNPSAPGVSQYACWIHRQLLLNSSGAKFLHALKYILGTNRLGLRDLNGWYNKRFVSETKKD